MTAELKISRYNRGKGEATNSHSNLAVVCDEGQVIRISFFTFDKNNYLCKEK